MSTIEGLYLHSNGNDYYMRLKDRSKVVIQRNIITGAICELPFPTYTDAKNNITLWLNNSCLRLPKVFCIKVSNGLLSHTQLIRALHENKLDYPVQAEDWKEYLIYHNNQFMTLDKFDNNLIPELDIKYLKKVALSKKIKEIKIDQKMEISSGLFERGRIHA